MEKRMPLFLLLSFAVLMAWTMLFAPKPSEPDRAPDATEVSGDGVSIQAGVETSAPPEVELVPPKGEVVVDTEERDTGPLYFGDEGAPGLYLARFSNRGARLVELRLGDFFDEEGLSEDQRHDSEHWVRLVVPVETPGGFQTGSMLLRASASSRELLRGEELENALWRMEVLKSPSGRPQGVEFTYAPGSGVRFVKRFLFRPGQYRIGLEIELVNDGAGASSTREFMLTPAGCMPAELDDRFYVEPKAVAAGPALVDVGEMSLASIEKNPSARDSYGALACPTPLAFAGVHNKYFAFLLSETVTSLTDKRTLSGASYERVPDAEWIAQNPREAQKAWRFLQTHVNLELGVPGPGESKTYRYEVYAGPKDREILVADDPSHGLVLEEDLGWFSSIGTVLLYVLGLFQRLTHNWGVAIILLTLCIRGVLFPLNRRFQTSMARYQKKMKRVQPKIEEIKERFAKDPQKLRQEQARIMQEEGAFPPLGGCLPMFVQIPIFIGLFSALRTNFDLRHAPFGGWIKDLSQPDRLLALDLEIPFLPIDLSYLNILPILMVVLWILQQRGMPTPADEQAARMQKMMMFMPVVMGVFLYNYAAGLSLYMITQSGLGIFEQKFIKKHWPIDDAEQEKEKPGCGPFSGFMKNLAEKQKAHMKKMETMKGAGQARTPAKRRKRRR